MAKVAKNLFLDEDAADRGERYSELHKTNLSQIVSDFLNQLPIDDAPRELSPAVARLLGIAAGTAADRDSYRKYLRKKFGGR